MDKEQQPFCLGKSGKASAAAAAKSLQSCPTLCDPIDSLLPGSPVPGILQARTLEWVAISFSNAWKWKVKVKSLSHVWLLVTSWTAAPRLLRPWDFPDKSTGVGCHCLLQRKASKKKQFWIQSCGRNTIYQESKIRRVFQVERISLCH